MKSYSLIFLALFVGVLGENEIELEHIEARQESTTSEGTTTSSVGPTTGGSTTTIQETTTTSVSSTAPESTTTSVTSSTPTSPSEGSTTTSVTATTPEITTTSVVLPTSTSSPEITTTSVTTTIPEITTTSVVLSTSTVSPEITTTSATTITGSSTSTSSPETTTTSVALTTESSTSTSSLETTTTSVATNTGSSTTTSSPETTTTSSEISIVTTTEANETTPSITTTTPSPGNADEQCRNRFPLARSVSSYNPSNASPCRIYCQYRLIFFTHRTNFPVRDLTTCGDNMVCIAGDCIRGADQAEIQRCQDRYPGRNVTATPSRSNQCEINCNPSSTGRIFWPSRPRGVPRTDGIPCTTSRFIFFTRRGTCSNGRCKSRRSSRLSPPNFDYIQR